MDEENNQPEASFNDRLDKVFAELDKEHNLTDKEDTSGNANDPAPAGTPELPEKEAIGEDQLKPNNAEKDKQTASAIEPPVSWPSNDKEAFKSLPTWAQERISARESEREAHFSERSRTIAAREQELNSIQSRAQQEQQRYAAELQRVNQLATQLLPAKFSDITSEADYLRLKVEDPARASEYEAFVQILRNAQGQTAQMQQQQLQQKLDSEWQALQAKYPEFKDSAKGNAIINEVRKAAVDYYGFTPQEVEIIPDHRHIPIIRDAIAWRNHKANLKAAEGKKVPNAPTPTLRSTGAVAGANIGAEAKTKIINRAGKETDLRRKAEMIAGLI